MHKLCILIAELFKGGGIAAAFVSTFPNLSTGRVAFIASTGIMDVGSVMFCIPYLGAFAHSTTSLLISLAQAKSCHHRSFCNLLPVTLY